jgi:hypothetical protein
MSEMTRVLIEIPVDKELAAAYNAADDEQREKVALMVKLMLRDIAAPKLLSETINDLSAKAQANGLTPEILAQILAEDDE